MNKTTPQQSIQKSHYLEAFLLFVAFFLQNRPRLLGSSLNGDEILSWDLQSGSWLHLLTGVYNDTQQVLYNAVVKIFLAFTPVNDYWVRIPSLALSSAAVALIYLYIRRHFSWPTALFFAFTSIIHPLLSFVATFNRPYSLMLLLMCINFISVRNILYHDDKRNTLKWIALLSAIGIGFTHYLGLFYLLSVLIGVVLSSGLKSVRTILDSTAKVLLSLTSATVLAGCLYHQLQFNSYIGWAFEEGSYNFFDGLTTVTGIGGFFLLAGLFRIHKISQLPDQEKMLLFSFIAVLLLIAMSGLWVPQYMLILAPMSFLLSAYYLEQIILFISKSSLQSYTVCFGFLALILLNPLFTRQLKSNSTFPLAIEVFFASFRVGDTPGIKKLLSEIKNKDLVAEQTKVLCVTDTITYPEKPMALYSKMYWNRDICTTYVKDLTSVQNLPDYHYVINMTSLAYKAVSPQNVATDL